MEEMQHEVEIRSALVESMHSRASEDLLFAVKNPVFTEYFELPETRAGDRHDENGLLQFTDRQRAVKAELEQWIASFQSKFQVDETCLINHMGQEHARLVLNEIAADEELSSSEAASPFFTASFLTQQGKVFIQPPYVSPDTERWVFAYTTPIVLSDGSTPSFYHFEMPMKIFQDLVDTNVGRIYIMDQNGLLFADSQTEYDNRVGSAAFKMPPEDFFQIIDTTDRNNGLSDVFQSAWALSPGQEGTGSYVVDGEDHYLAYQKLPTFGWILVYEKPYSLMLAGDTTLGQLGMQIALISSLVGAGSVFSVFLVASRIANPISSLATALRSQEIGNLKKVKATSSSKEVSNVVNAVNEMVSKINTLEKQKDEFASMITHELRTPLTPILGWCQALKNPRMTGATLNGRQNEAVDIIHRNAKRLEALVSDMLDVQKLDMKKMRFNMQDIVAHEIVESVMANFKEAMKPKNIEFINKSAVIGGEIIKSDRNRIEQVLNNLVANAIDFVPDKGGKIELCLTDRDNDVMFYVRDNGIGVPLEKQSSLFAKFYQVDSSLTRKHGGSGLGLAVCKGIVESLGGKIWLESETGKGAAFYFAIPKLEASMASMMKEELKTK